MESNDRQGHDPAQYTDNKPRPSQGFFKTFAQVVLALNIILCIPLELPSQDRLMDLDHYKINDDNTAGLQGYPQREFAQLNVIYTDLPTRAESTTTQISLTRTQTWS